MLLLKSLAVEISSMYYEMNDYVIQHHLCLLWQVFMTCFITMSHHFIYQGKVPYKETMGSKSFHVSMYIVIYTLEVKHEAISVMSQLHH